MKITLTIYGDKPEKKAIELTGPGVFVLGSGEDADCRFNDARVSKAQLELEIEGESVRLRDLDSLHGTDVDGGAL